ncbi:phosphohydrolase [Clostridium estertheticum]|uniref:HD domain-containing protein n=1 Tax=Clostridium estertheticum TaxID=238834 RepID=UPI0013E990B4|nr:phosphohydrolase [Clostridium estertheticum]MBZ9684968.1 phosphohydrolase [Clostridium estertheticum]
MEIKLDLRKNLSASKKIRIEEIQKQIVPVIARTTNINIDFTEHDISHALSVEEMYTNCFPNIDEVLTEDEKYLLIISTLIHDVGMVGQSKYKLEENYDKELRESHNYRSGDFIKQYSHVLGIMDRDARVIEKIAQGHRLVNLNSLPESEPFGIGNSIRIRLLAGLLRLADEFDILEERAPYLVKEFLNVNTESAVHFDVHRTFQGIELHGNTLKIVSYVPNSELEDEVIKLCAGICKKFDEVKPILNENDINLISIEVNIVATEVVKHEIMLCLACKGIIEEDELINEFKIRKMDDVIEALRELYATGIIEKNAMGLVLSEKLRHFKYIKDIFIGSRHELEFTKSIYLNTYLKNIFEDYVKSKFGVFYEKGQCEDRINILTHSPTSIKYFFDSNNTPYEIGSVDRRTTLELGLLHALAIDALKYPEELTEEVLLSSKAIEEEVNNKLYSFLKLISAIPQAEKKNNSL